MEKEKEQSEEQTSSLVSSKTATTPAMFVQSFSVLLRKNEFGRRPVRQLQIVQKRQSAQRPRDLEINMLREHQEVVRNHQH